MKLMNVQIPNPLAIIGLFVSFIYSMAGLVTLFSHSLCIHQMWVFIVFLVTFPFVLLAVFVHLVIYHNRRLYSPSEFTIPAQFDAPLSQEFGERIRQEQSEETDVIDDTSPPPDSTTHTAQTQSRPHASTENEYIVAEELAIRAFETERGTAVYRQFAIPSTSGKFRFDGVAIIEGHLHLIEVKYFTNPTNRRFDSTILKVFEQWRRVSTELGNNGNHKSYNFHLFVIVPNSAEQNDIREWSARIQHHCRALSISFNIAFTITRIGDLKTRFGL